MPATRIPGPTGLPLIGSLLALKRDPLQAYLDAQRDHGDVVRFTAGLPGVRAEFYMEDYSEVPCQHLSDPRLRRSTDR